MFQAEASSSKVLRRQGGSWRPGGGASAKAHGYQVQAKTPGSDEDGCGAKKISLAADNMLGKPEETHGTAVLEY